MRKRFLFLFAQWYKMTISRITLQKIRSWKLEGVGICVKWLGGAGVRGHFLNRSDQKGTWIGACCQATKQIRDGGRWRIFTVISQTRVLWISLNLPPASPLASQHNIPLWVCSASNLKKGNSKLNLDVMNKLQKCGTCANTFNHFILFENLPEEYNLSETSRWQI